MEVKNKQIEIENTLNEIFKEKQKKENEITLKAMEIEECFLKNLVKLRKEKGLSQEEVEKKSGLIQQSISKLETGKQKPTLLNLIKYMLALGLDINKLLEDV